MNKTEEKIKVDSYSAAFYYFSLPEPVGKLHWIYAVHKLVDDRYRYLLKANPLGRKYVVVLRDFASTEELAHQLINLHMEGDPESHQDGDYWKIIEAFCVSRPNDAVDWFEENDDDE